MRLLAEIIAKIHFVFCFIVGTRFKSRPTTALPDAREIMQMLFFGSYFMWLLWSCLRIVDQMWSPFAFVLGIIEIAFVVRIVEWILMRSYCWCMERSVR